jgi:hypothetical protein
VDQMCTNHILAGPCLSLTRTWTRTSSISSSGSILVYHTRSESLDARKVHVERCSHCWLLRTWHRRAVVERRA